MPVLESRVPDIIGPGNDQNMGFAFHVGIVPNGNGKVRKPRPLHAYSVGPKTDLLGTPEVFGRVKLLEGLARADVAVVATSAEPRLALIPEVELGVSLVSGSVTEMAAGMVPMPAGSIAR